MPLKAVITPKRLSITYKCEICNYTCKQRGHQTNHVQSEKHQQDKRIKELEIGNLSESERISEYGSADIKYILDSREFVVFDRFGRREAFIPTIEPIDKLTLKECKDEVVWTVEDNQDENPEYVKIQSELKRVIKQCHDTLYSSSCPTVGEKARSDIISILTLKLMEREFNTDGSYIHNIIIKREGDDDYIKQCCDIENLADTDVFDKWGELIREFLKEILPEVYAESDQQFNCDDEVAIGRVIRSIKTLDINDNFMDAFTINCGDVHEYFRAYEGKHVSKALGQFFTPRNMINLVFHQSVICEYLTKCENPTVYDPCMGTGGFLTRFHKLSNNSPTHLFGCELNNETLKFGSISMLLTTGVMNENIIRCDSLSDNKFMFNNKKFDIIVTNPPFGTRLKYDDQMNKFDDQKPRIVENGKDEDDNGAGAAADAVNENAIKLNFHDIYPVKTNVGTELFIQHCVYMLNNGGLCMIILPDGKLFEGKTSKKFRTWLINTINIHEIIRFPNGVFEHAGVSTCAVIFTKDGYTKNIAFKSANKECTEVTALCDIEYKELVFSEYSLNHKDYISRDRPAYVCDMVKLGDVCDIKTGTRIVHKDTKAGEYYVYGGGGKTFTTENYNREANTVIIGRFGISAHCVRYIQEKFYLNDNGMSIHTRDETKLNNNYMRYYMGSIQDEIFACASGSAQKGISMDKLNSIEIPLPPINIQKEIVEKMDKLELSKQTITSRIAQADDEIKLFIQYNWVDKLHPLFDGCDMVKLGDVCKFDKKSKRNASYGKEIGEYPFFTSSQKLTKFCDEPDYDKLAIIIGTGGTANVKLSDKFSCSNHNTVIAHENLDTTRYIYNYLKANLNILDEKFIGSGLKNLSNESIMNLEIPLPSADIQKEIVEVYIEMDKYRTDMAKKIENENNYIIDLNQLARKIFICG